MDEQKKNYHLTFMGEFDVHVEVDHAVLTDEKLREYLGFWISGEELYDTPLKAFLTMLCREIMARSVRGLHVSDAFDNGHVEGYPSLDGTEGIEVSWKKWSPMFQ